MLQDFSYGIIPIKFENNQCSYLVIKHNAGHWSFPKGHKEGSEEDLETAIRELKEETNLDIEKIISNETLEEFYHFYLKDQLIEKKVRYFIAETKGHLKIQDDELVDCKWASFEEALDLITFDGAKSILKQAKKLIQRVKP
jgi:bis(5'-nucleosidyl)-tetraphosphatase